MSWWSLRMSTPFSLLCLILWTDFPRNATFRPNMLDYLNTTFTFGKQNKDNFINTKFQSIYPGAFRTHGRTNIAGVSRFGEVALHPGLYRFQICALCHEVSHWELYANIPSLPFFLSQYSLNRHLRFMTTGEEQRPIWKLTAFRSLKAPVSQRRSNKTHAELHLLYQSVYQSLCSDFRHSWIQP